MGSLARLLDQVRLQAMISICEGLKISSLSGDDSRIGSMAGTAIVWGLESGRTANRAPWLYGVIKVALRMGRAISWDLFSSSPESSNVVSQYLGDGFSMPHPLSPSISDPQWSGSTVSANECP